MTDTNVVKMQRREEAQVPTWSDLLTVEELVQSGQVTDSMTLVNYGIGGAGYLTREFARAAAQELCRALASSISPHTPVYLGVMGYDDDPRELHEIPEVQQYLGWFAAEFDKAGIDETRLIQQSRELVSLGRAYAAGVEVELVDAGGSIVDRLVQEFQDAAVKKLS